MPLILRVFPCPPLLSIFTLSLFPWARYKSAQHALKLHTLLDLRGSIPTFIRVTAAQYTM
jgi:hypothetical protein